MEKWLNILIGSILINNFYYLFFFIGIDYSFIIVLCALISIFFFLKSALFYKNVFAYLFKNSSLTVIVSTIVILSIFFCVINPHADNDVDLNDIIRILILFFYFGWSGMRFGSKEKLPNFILTFSIFSLTLSFFICSFEYNFPGIFGIIFKEGRAFDETTWIRRIAGTIRDPNAFSCIIIVYSFFIYHYLLKHKQNWIIVPYLLCLFAAINLTGSRQGFLLFIILASYILYIMQISPKAKLYILIMFVLFLTVLIINGLTSSSEVDSVAARIFKENDQAKGSENDRIRSVFDGLRYSFNNYFCLYGPGGILFNKFWERSHSDLSEVPPHNVILFLFTQFGIFAYLVYIGLWSFFKKAIKVKLYIVGLLFFLIIALLPSVLYTGVSLILVWYIDVCHNGTVLPNDEHSLIQNK